ncbi:MAG: hypothetical protein IPL31_10600 [Saprospiraceae bacterium]|nr:hypothetical protein [Saprospiraceae bacterium]
MQIVKAHVLDYFYICLVMHTNVLISLDTRRKKADGIYPLVLRIGHFRRTTSISLGYSIPIVDWDKSKRKIKTTSKVVTNIAWLNNFWRRKDEGN